MTKAEFNKRRAFAAENPFEEVHRKGCLPPAAAVDSNIEKDNNYFYYVVSYSREDSRYVLPEIYDLQAAGFEIWYDHGIVDRVTQDNDWRKVVRDRISDFHCRGVLFYISENFVLSPSIEEEVRMVKEAGKPHLEIALPMTETGHENKFYQAWKIATIAQDVKSETVLNKNGFNKKRVELYKEMFDDSVNFIKHSAPMEERYSGLNGMKIPELFEFRINDLKYILGGESRIVAELVAVNNLDVANVVIPEKTIIDSVEYDVAWIGTCAFANCRKLKHVVFPKTVALIDSHAFYNCCNLQELNLPENLQYIGANAFEDCVLIPQIVVPKSLQWLEMRAFCHCVGLNEVVNSKYIEYIGERTFSFCGKLKEFEFAPNVRIGNAAFLSSGVRDLKFTGDVIRIGEAAFLNSDIEQLELPTQTWFIGMWAFKMCKNLVRASLGFCKEIKTEIFEECSALSYIQMSYNSELKVFKTFGKSSGDVTLEITPTPKDLIINPNRNSFEISFDNVHHLILPNDLIKVGKKSIDCKDVIDIIIPDSVEEIEPFAFYWCQQLTRVVFGKRVKSIGFSALKNRKLDSVEFKGDVKRCIYKHEPSDPIFASLYKKIRFDTTTDFFEHPSRESVDRMEEIEQRFAIEKSELDITDLQAVLDVLEKGHEIQLYY